MNPTLIVALNKWLLKSQNLIPKAVGIVQITSTVFLLVDYDNWKDVPVLFDRYQRKKKQKSAESALIYVEIKTTFPMPKPII